MSLGLLLLKKRQRDAYPRTLKIRPIRLVVIIAILAVILVLSSGQPVIALETTVTPSPAGNEAPGSGLWLMVLLAGGLLFLTIIMIVVVAAVVKKFKNWPDGRQGGA
jgi:hypothetical protein